MTERKTLIADDGYIYTDGTNYGRIVYLAEGDDGSKWHQITHEEFVEMLNKQELGEPTIDPDDATEVDYQNALESLGVKFDA